ncbi:hypothetical protein F4809DRAFT_642788 [Biscogniauxia mediterranea]|nr:hypothetical protein F4809DRAFT_642788 [Biscogniauxia mediterranea]
MAVMDTIEASSTNKERCSGAAPAEPTSDHKTRETTPRVPISSAFSLNASFASSNPVHSSTSHSHKKHRGLIRLPGPSPEKGSGQDRFRQIIQASRDSIFFRDKKDSLSITTPVKAAHNTTLHCSPGHSTTVPPSFTLPKAASGGHLVAMNKYSDKAQLLPAAKPGPTTTAGTFRTPNVNRTGKGATGAPHSTTGTNPGDWRKPPTAALSMECQKRSFNPSFTEHVTKNGEFRYSVDLNGTILRSSRSFPTAMEAKHDLAKQAVARVRKMPYRSPSARAHDKVKYEAAKLDTMNNRCERGPLPEPVRSTCELRAGPIGYSASARGTVTAPVTPTLTHGQSYIRYDPGVGSGYDSIKYDAVGYDYRCTGGYDRSFDRREELNFLMNRIQSLFGRSDGPSMSVLKDPLASRAYLEGFALGGRLHESAYRQPADNGHLEAPQAPRLEPYTYVYLANQQEPGLLYTLQKKGLNLEHMTTPWIV